MKNFFMKNIYKILMDKIFNPFLNLNIKPMELVLNEEDKCLVIAPHPDDESIGCGGIMSLYPKNFEVVCLTHGSDEIRSKEFKNAMEFLNIKNEMLDLKDKHILDGEKDFNIDIKDFNYIFIPYIFDQHKDHKAVSVLLNKLLKKSNHKKDLKIVFYEVWSAMNMPNCYVNISEVIENKKTAINFHQSQVKEKDYTSKIIGLNEYRGMIKNIKAAECFTLLTVEEYIKMIGIVYGT